ncbi:uncharacterized protein BO87DRAFT_161595 [Aspergillus neoniger CBS 115656]|uniref:Uncharacterized protein n=1 Tax=Aspergillus neoniger (strain CBS 115656) TaxID=1448310 RepID=A0A318YTD6_ASPNB|nr:hypothetical protein BO87DRAFT_161595 [Aspergillus neoniger CBS 115656]PYH38035.1 hypothetical protein BO87DRAFT_161595 [Aspergillus neoniger CBS 115656]
MSSFSILPASTTTLAMCELYPPRTYRSFNDCKTEISVLWGRLRERERDVNHKISTTSESAEEGDWPH